MAAVIWINKEDVEKLDKLERKLVDEFKIAYQPGKGTTRLVSVLMPKDTLQALKLLKNKELRKMVGISEKNFFVFASTDTAHKTKQTNLDGSSALKYCTKDLVLKSPEKITATRNRHYMSTLYNGLGIHDPTERRLFFEHMGHNPDMNRDNYQCPPALATITKVGKHLISMEQGKNHSTG